jgi:hypothetical protein
MHTDVRECEILFHILRSAQNTLWHLRSRIPQMKGFKVRIER